METVNQANYRPKAGETPDARSLTQLAEYQPLQKMLANLTIAGLNSSAKQAMEFYDANKAEGDVDIPLLPRHIHPDITEVQRVTEIFWDRKMMIEERVRVARAREVEELRKRQLSKQVDGASPLAGSRGSAPPPGTAEQ